MHLNISSFYFLFDWNIYFFFYLQGMQAPRMNIPNIGNNNQQSVHYTTMGQPPTTQTYYNNPVLFPAQPNRPPSGIQVYSNEGALPFSKAR